MKNKKLSLNDREKRIVESFRPTLKKISEASRYDEDKKFKDFNEWVDAVTNSISQNSYYKSKFIDTMPNNEELIQQAGSDLGKLRELQYQGIKNGDIEFVPMEWDTFTDLLKSEYAKKGNVFDIFLKYGTVYNNETGYLVLGGWSGTGNHRNAGCHRNGLLTLCWGSFSSIGEWDSRKKEGIGPETIEDNEKLVNQIYPKGSRMD